MPTIKDAKASGVHRRRTRGASSASQPSASDARALLATMIDYEAAAYEHGIDFTASRYRQMTASERDLVRAELIADYIRLSASSAGSARGEYETALTAYCSKVCDMGLPSQEIAGTYLAALDVISVSPRLQVAQPLARAARSTMPEVLKGCVNILRERSLGVSTRAKNL